MRRLDRRAWPALALSLVVLLAAPPAAHASSAVHAHAYPPPRSAGDDFGWAVIGGSGDCASDALDDDVRAGLAREAEAAGAPVLWLRVDGREWVIRDRATVARAEAILRPMRELGRAMGALGGKMGRHGAELGRHGAELGRHGAEVGRLAAERAAIEVRLATARLDRHEPLDERERARLRQECRALAREQAREQARLEAARERTAMRGTEVRMKELGRRMETMGGRMRDAAARAKREMRALAREAIAARRAERLGDAV